MVHSKTNRVVARLAEKAQAKVGAVLPYFTAGYPDNATAAEFIRRADALGAPVIEIGVPYSDSIADGPVIQDSFNYVLARSYRLDDAFDLVRQVRESVTCGLVAMVSFSIVHRYGLDRFMRVACAAGLDGVILPDVPAEEAAATLHAATSANLCHIGLIAPTTCETRTKAIARTSTGFIYQIAVSGTTGERAMVADALSSEVAAVRRVSNLPVCVGFGVSRPEHVRSVCKVADGAIVGSGIVRRIGDGIEAGADHAQIADSVSAFIGTLTEAAATVES